MVRAIEHAGFTPGADIAISLDVAASEFGRNGRYRLAREDRTLDSDGLAALLIDWIERYPIVAIEDPLGEDDPQGLARFTAAVGDRVEIIGDDFLVTNAGRVAAAAGAGACNAVLIKPNQAGTLSEARAAVEAARAAGFGAIVSARSGETEDVTIVHLAVGWGVPQLKGRILRAVGTNGEVERRPQDRRVAGRRAAAAIDLRLEQPFRLDAADPLARNGSGPGKRPGPSGSARDLNHLNNDRQYY